MRPLLCTQTVTDRVLVAQMMQHPKLQRSLRILQAPVIELGTLLQEMLEENPVWELELPALGGEGTDFLYEVAAPVCVRDRIRQQIEQEFLCSVERALALACFDVVDERGLYDPKQGPVGVSEELLKRLQTLDPPGIFARSQRESLLLQLERLGRVGSLAYQLLVAAPEALIAMRMRPLVQLTGLSSTALVRQLRVDLKGVRLGHILEESPCRRIEPDVVLLQDQGRWVIDCNESHLPRLYLQPAYHGLLESLEGMDSFVERSYRDGLFLQRALFQRQVTLKRILEFVIPRQQAFLHIPGSSAQVLTLAEVAQHLQLAESTISRAVAEKWMSTPRGLLPMRSLFSLPSTVQGACVGVELRGALRQIVASEPPQEPFSDQVIAERLKEQGFQIARRTVAKYREELGIPSQRGRRWAQGS